MIAKLQRAAQSAMLNKGQFYVSGLLEAVKFSPDRIGATSIDVASFPWTATTRSLNGFHSVHGGCLATLADAFTKIHVAAKTSQELASSFHPVSTVHFDIRFLSALSEGEKCICCSTISHLSRKDNVAFADFTFISEKNGELMAMGTHIIKVGEEAGVVAA